jgi:hypothetical protein
MPGRIIDLAIFEKEKVSKRKEKKGVEKVSVNGIAIFPLEKVLVQSAAELPILFTDPVMSTASRMAARQPAPTSASRGPPTPRASTPSSPSPATRMDSPTARRQ